MTVEVIAVGGCTVDVVYNAEGKTSGRQLGGNAVYAAAGASLWGVRAGVLAFRGTGLPEGWKAMLAGLDIESQGMIEVDVPAPASEFHYDETGDRLQRVLHADGHADKLKPYLAADTGEPIRRLVLTSAHMPASYFAARGIHLAPLSFPVQRALAQEMASRRILTLDPSPYAMAEASDAELAKVLSLLTAFLPSREEVAVRFPSDADETALHRMAAWGAPVIVIKRGRAGALLYDGHRKRVQRVPVIPVQAKDPTGAGDAFCGGFLAGLVETGDPIHAAICGAVSASFAVEDFSLNGMAGADRTERERRYVWAQNSLQ